MLRFKSYPRYQSKRLTFKWLRHGRKPFRLSGVVGIADMLGMVCPHAHGCGWVKRLHSNSLYHTSLQGSALKVVRVYNQ